MATHRIILTDPALADLDEISEYIAEDSPVAAKKMTDSILAGIDSLGSLPARFKKVGVSRSTGTAIHWLIVHPSLIYYRVDEAAVYILTIRHGRRRRLKRFD